MKDDELRKAFEAWLAQHFTPARTASGEVRTRKGVIDYENMHHLRIYLDGSCVEAVERFRRGAHAPIHVTKQVEDMVVLDDPAAIRAHCRDRDVERDLGFAIRFYEEFGMAPDGGDLRSWARRCVERHNRVREVETPLRSELWDRIFWTPPANATRRARAARRAA